MSYAAVLLLSLLALSAASFPVERADAATRKAPPADTVAPADPAHRYAERADVRAFVDELVEEQGFDKRTLTRAFAAARYQPRIVAAMDRPLVEPPKWYEYAPQFLTPERIDGGVAFYARNAAALERAEREFGVPADVIVAIIGVETYYGRNLGSYRVFDALTTLAFDYPRRATFFRGELKEYLRLTREQGLSPLAPKGSFAGAMGVPQFMPGSYRRFAIDFDGDAHVDLWASTADVIGSVANYLARHDWQPGEPVLLPATIDADERDAVLRKLDGGMSERRTLAAWESDGVTADTLASQLPADTVGLLALEDPPADGAARATYWIACANFFVITRYNRSRLYASAVWSLSEAIRKARDASRTP
ncbi:MAG: lytic murein transglycosylase B [Casimicrobiaceae bacterium]